MDNGMYRTIDDLSQCGATLQQISYALEIVLDGLEKEGYAPAVGKDHITIDSTAAICFICRYPMYHEALALFKDEIMRVASEIDERSNQAIAILRAGA